MPSDPNLSEQLNAKGKPVILVVGEKLDELTGAEALSKKNHRGYQFCWLSEDELSLVSTYESSQIIGFVVSYPRSGHKTALEVALELERQTRAMRKPVYFLATRPQNLQSAVDQDEFQQLCKFEVFDIIYPPFSAESLSAKFSFLAHLTSDQSSGPQQLVYESQAFLDSIVENIPNMVFVKEASELKFVRFNRAGEELLGISRKQLLGKNDFDLFDAESAAHFQSKDREVLASGTLLDIEEEKIQSSGLGERILHTRKIPINDPYGKPAYLLGISEDITDKKKADQQRFILEHEKLAREAAEASAQRMSLLVEATQVLGASLDYKKTLSSLSRLAVPAFADWCSVHLLERDGTLRQISAAHKDERKMEAVRILQESQEAVTPVDSEIGPYAVLRTGRSEFRPTLGSDIVREYAHDPNREKSILALGLASYICVPLTATGRTIGTMTFVTTESKRQFTQEDLALAEELAARAGLALENSRLYREAQSINQIKDEFLATLSHELRTPLNVIMGNAEQLKGDAGPLTAEEQSQSVDAIYRNAALQMQIIGDLLDVSSIITGKVTYRPELVSPPEILRNIVESIQPTAAAKGVRAVLNLEGAPHLLLADPTRLHQIVWNLVSNAIKFTDAGGLITIWLHEFDGMCRIEVADTGLGIEPDFLPYVFDRFRQEDGSTSRRFGGLGLGLSIARHLTELHGGTIRAESAGKGRGAKFIVSLPLRQTMPLQSGKVAKDPLAPLASALFENRNLNGIRVLLIEDSVDSRVLVARMLRRAGATVLEVGSAAAARTALTREDPDIIVSDIGMPGEDGIEFIKSLRRAELGAGRMPTPAIALTAYVRSEEQEQMRAAGFQAHVAKPVSERSLIAALGHVLSGGRLPVMPAPTMDS
jgi:PAS domain S-box-containing protein